MKIYGRLYILVIFDTNCIDYHCHILYNKHKRRKDMFRTRILSISIHNIKNIHSGTIRFPGYISAKNHGTIPPGDVTGIYGQNGSGKTAIVEAMDIMRYIMLGERIPFQVYSGMLPEGDGASIILQFLNESGNAEYFSTYEVSLRTDYGNGLICIDEERLITSEKGYHWKKEYGISIKNGHYHDADNLFLDSGEPLSVVVDTKLKALTLFSGKTADKLGAFCAGRGISMFFCDRSFAQYHDFKKGHQEENSPVHPFLDILFCLEKFAVADLNVIKVNQLAEINSDRFIPVNMRDVVSRTQTVNGVLPLFQRGEGEMNKDLFIRMCHTVDTINKVLPAIVPGLSIQFGQVSSSVNKDGEEIITAKAYSVRDGMKFSTCYESEGIKRIISLIHALASVYNYREACLVVDELDSGIFEYLLGEIVGEMHEGSRGQLIFTSHNLRVLEKLPSRNIICTTTNPENRYIRFRGVAANNNARDTFIRAISLGGQEEEIYNEADLESLSLALRMAGDKPLPEIHIPDEVFIAGGEA